MAATNRSGAGVLSKACLVEDQAAEVIILVEKKEYDNKASNLRLTST